MSDDVGRSVLRIPEWARNGRIAYCRWDGGPMEVAKAGLSGWDLLTSPVAVRAMYEVYGKKGFELVKQAGFNWIWVTWSCGFSHRSEELQHEVLKPFIKKCKQADIKLTAYLSMCNMFVHDITEHQPELLGCLQKNASDEFIPYAAAVFGDKPERLMACLNDQVWLEHLENRLASAIDNGFDAAFYDNLGPWCMCERCQDSFASYTKRKLGRALPIPDVANATSPVFEEVAAQATDGTDETSWQVLQAYWADLLLDKAVRLTRFAEKLKPDFMVYVNWHIYHHTFGSPELKALSTEDGQKCCYMGEGREFATMPGFEYRGYGSNAGLLRRMLATADGQRPLRMQSHQFTDVPMEGREFELYLAKDWQRLLAECWCFRAGQEVFLEGNFFTELFAGTQRAVEAWQGIADYNKFQSEHSQLWCEAEQSCCAFAVLITDNYPTADSDWQRYRLFTALALEGFQFDVVLNHQLSADRLSKYSVLWCADTECLSDDELAVLEGYLGGGGMVVCTDKISNYSSLACPRSSQERKVWIDRLSQTGGERFVITPPDICQKVRAGELGAVAEQVRQAQEKFPITVECDEGPVLWTCWQSSDGKMLIYCLNPDDRSARSNVVIAANVKAHSASFHSPDSATKLDSIESRGEDVMCTIRTLDVFGYLELTIPC